MTQDTVVYFVLSIIGLMVLYYPIVLIKCTVSEDKDVKSIVQIGVIDYCGNTFKVGLGDEYNIDDIQLCLSHIVDYFENNNIDCVYSSYGGFYWNDVNRFVRIVNNIPIDYHLTVAVPEHLVYDTLKRIYDHNKGNNTEAYVEAKEKLSNKKGSI